MLVEHSRLTGQKLETLIADKADTETPLKDTVTVGAFTVTLKNLRENGTLGLDLDHTGELGAMISDIKFGAVQRFNELNPSESIQIYDRIQAIDEAKGSVAVIRKIASIEEAVPETLTLSLVRPRRVTVSIVKTGANPTRWAQSSAKS